MQKRYEDIDVLRGIAAILVVLGHSFITHPINIIQVSWCRYLHDFIFTFHMPLFFLLAGYVYKQKNYILYLRAKAKRLLLPYGCFCLISLVLHMVAGDAVSEKTSLMDGLKSILLSGGDYWFIYVLFIIFMIYPLIDRLCSRSFMCLVGVTLLFAVQLFVSLPNLFSIENVIYYLPYFMMGNMLKKYCVRGDISGKMAIGTSVVALLAYGAVAVLTGLGVKNHACGKNIFLASVPAGCC